MAYEWAADDNDYWIIKAHVVLAHTMEELGKKKKKAEKEVEDMRNFKRPTNSVKTYLEEWKILDDRNT